LVDEAKRDPGPGLGAFILGCVVIPHAERDDLRRHVINLGPFHFSGSTYPRKRMMLKQIGAWGLLSTGYVKKGVYGKGFEGARQDCIRRLLADLKDWGIDEVIFETRRDHENTRDSLTISGLANIGLAPKSLVCHWRGKDEQLLRLPDAIAGAVRAAAGNPPGHVQTLKEIKTAIRTVP
jgi:hypothetical protein